MRDVHRLAHDAGRVELAGALKSMLDRHDAAVASQV
jgi:hypothetical protein